MSYNVLVVDDSHLQALAITNEIKYYDPSATVIWKSKENEAKTTIETTPNLAFLVIDVYLEPPKGSGNTKEHADWLVPWVLADPRFQEIPILVVSKLPEKLDKARRSLKLKKDDTSRVAFQSLGASEYATLGQAIRELIESAQRRFGTQ